jgi:hypothetical protein
MHAVLLENIRGRNHLGNVDTDVRIILSFIDRVYLLTCDQNVCALQ